MKKLLLLVLFSSLVLAGCAQQGLSQSELFEKKQECIKYEKDIQNAIEEVNLWWKNEPDVAPHNESLREVFYSPIKNSCLYGVNVIEQIPESSKISKPGVCSFYKIYDFLTKENEEIYLEHNEDLSCNTQQSLEAYNATVRKLKK